MQIPKLCLLAALAAGQLLACGDSTSGDDAGVADDALVDDGATDGLPKAPCVVQPEEFALNQETESEQGLFAVRIVGADPAPPAKFSNAWEVEIVTPEGAPMEDATITDVEPWMPSHQHGAGYAVEVTPLEGSTFQLDPLYLWMSGGWIVTISAEAGGQSDKAVVDVCIPQ